MAVQQNKKSHARKCNRRSHDRVATPSVIYCESCDPSPQRLPFLRHVQEAHRCSQGRQERRRGIVFPPAPVPFFPKAASGGLRSV